MIQLRSLIKDISVYGVSEFLNRSVQVLFLPIIFTYLSTSEFGTLDLFLTTKNIISVIFGWGMITAVQRFGGIKTEENYSLEEVITACFLVVIAIDLLLGVIFYFGYAILIETDIISFLLVLGISSFYSLRSIILGVLRLKHKAKAFLLVTLVNIIIYLLGTYILIKLTDLSYLAFLIAGLIGITFSFLLGLILIKGYIKIKVHKDLLKSIFKFGASLLSTALIVIFVASSNRYALGLFGQSLDEVGILGMSNRLSLFVGALLVAPFTLAWLPFVNENYMKDNFRDMVSTVFKAVVVVGIFLSVILIMVGYPILSYLEKDSYINSMLIAPFFCFSYIFQAGYYIFSSSFYIHEQNKLYVKSAAFVFIVNILMLSLIIPVTNYITVSVVTMITYLGQMLFAYFYSSRTFKLSSTDKIKLICYLLINGLLMSAIIYAYEFSLNIDLIIAVTVSVLCMFIFVTYFIFRKELKQNSFLIKNLS
ncbi:lipopolysaccharide biosynthesis protein [Gracilimonas tropica]|uniref:lipopolysaccharide biosynthesis protein n=1 Tax=Gracilimonas tropica TaxID=454600 RepID=UPI00039D0E10|nr:polysaccharide biosynthesis C-terminal domain-containing protein [Gracilimonas tropica]